MQVKRLGEAETLQLQRHHSGIKLTNELSVKLTLYMQIDVIACYDSSVRVLDTADIFAGVGLLSASDEERSVLFLSY